MVLMALDHVRVFAGVPAGGPTPALFFTRWVTNFCAPAFVFLAGTAAFLHAGVSDDKRGVTRYLATRGALLIALELTICRLSWTFNLDFYNYNQANVLWAIGWSMIALSLLVHLKLWMIGALGVAVITLHNVLDAFTPQLGPVLQHSPFAPLLQVLYFGGEFRWFGTGPNFEILYVLVPWVGVMAAGYAFGGVMRLTTQARDRWCYALGIFATALFIVLRATNAYGNPWPWKSDGGALKATLSFLQTAKYPASLQFLCMTLGPTIALLPILERARGRIGDWLEVYGRVPLFFYLLHIPLIHVVTLLISLVRTPDATWWLFGNHPVQPPPVPAGYRYSLPLLYLVTAGCVLALYLPCKWYRRQKSAHRNSWLEFI